METKSELTVTHIEGPKHTWSAGRRRYAAVRERFHDDPAIDEPVEDTLVAHQCDPAPALRNQQPRLRRFVAALQLHLANRRRLEGRSHYLLEFRSCQPARVLDLRRHPIRQRLPLA